MGGEMPEDPNKTKDIIEAVTALTKAVPIYQDAVQPAAKELGKTLKTVVKAVNAALIPIEALVWGIDKIRDFVHTRVAQKLQNTPPEKIVTPDATIAGPVLESLRYTGHQESLRELYANLLANSMDERTAREAHPAFVDIIRNMNPDEAKIMQFLATEADYPIIHIKLVSKKDGSYSFVHRNVSLVGISAGCLNPVLTPSYIDNLERLGLIRVVQGRHLSDKDLYNSLIEHPEVKRLIGDIVESDDHCVETQKSAIEVTRFGWQFINACVIDKATKA
jgi:hypothetical protein